MSHFRAATMAQAETAVSGAYGYHNISSRQRAGDGITPLGRIAARWNVRFVPKAGIVDLGSTAGDGRFCWRMS